MEDYAVAIGPLFDGRAHHAAEDYTRHLERTLAQEVTNRIHAHLAGVIRVNRGIYESAIHTDSAGGGLEVTDYPIVYGPWLEGVGSRNSPVTRFPGYHTFRTVSQQFQSEVQDISERELPRYLEEMN